jgi:glycosyltransferase involved in cell wall biosynthesis
MIMRRPLVSVIVPVYNGEKFLAEALASVFAQTYRPLEAIVVDDGSTDHSAEVVRAFPEVRCCVQPHAGLGAARNRGVDEARGAFLAFLDADDLWSPGKLAHQMAVFDAHPEVDIVFGHAQQFHRPLSAGANVEDEPLGAPMPGCIASSALMRRASFYRVGPMATQWRLGEFIDWYARAQEAGLNSIMLPDVLIKRRIHAENMGIRERDSRIDYVRIVKASLDRRRALSVQRGPSDGSSDSRPE